VAQLQSMALADIAMQVQELITFYAVQPLIILFLGIFIAKITEQVLLFVFRELKRTHTRYEFAAYVVKWLIYIATVLYALASINLLAATLWFFAGVTVALLLVRIILSLYDFFPNFFSHHAVRSRYKKGSKVRMQSIEGTVVAVQLLDTHVRTAAGDELFIPNRTMRALKKS
jgi:small-conductance mechanosensitive channel